MVVDTKFPFDRRIGFDVEEKNELGYVAMNKAVEGFDKRLAAGAGNGRVWRSGTL